MELNVNGIALCTHLRHKNKKLDVKSVEFGLAIKSATLFFLENILLFCCVNGKIPMVWIEVH